MPRPTFTASEVARYTFCNLAWSYDVLGVPTLSPDEVRREKALLLKQKAPLSPEQRQDLQYLQSMEHSYARRASGESYHASLAKQAIGFRQTARRIFATVLIALAAALVIWLLLRA
jgi:hypothetical protein